MTKLAKGGSLENEDEPVDDDEVAEDDEDDCDPPEIEDEDEDVQERQEAIAQFNLSTKESIFALLKNNKIPVSSYFSTWALNPSVSPAKLVDVLRSALALASNYSTLQVYEGLGSRLIPNFSRVLFIDSSFPAPDWLSKAFDASSVVLVPEPSKLIATEPLANQFNKDLEEIVDWFKSLKDQSEISTLSWQACVDKHKTWVKEMNAKTSLKILAECPVVLELENHVVVQLLTREALKQEGKLMDHCIKGPNYWEKCKRGSHSYFSVRRKSNGRPVLTIEAVATTLTAPLTQNSWSKTLIPVISALKALQVKGRSNHTPTKYAALVFELEEKLKLYGAVREYGYSIVYTKSSETIKVGTYLGKDLFVKEGSRSPTIQHPVWTTPDQKSVYVETRVAVNQYDAARRNDEDDDYGEGDFEDEDDDLDDDDEDYDNQYIEDPTDDR